MEKSEIQQAVEKLYIELTDVMKEYRECIKRDDFFEIKRKLLSRIRLIEKDIRDLSMQLNDERMKYPYQ